jgi:hypothetical protein
MGEDKRSLVRVASVNAIGEFTLHIRWVNGEDHSVDLRDTVHRFKGLRALLQAKEVTAWSGPAISISAPIACCNWVVSRVPSSDSRYALCVVSPLSGRGAGLLVKFINH